MNVSLQKERINDRGYTYISQGKRTPLNSFIHSNTTIFYFSEEKCVAKKKNIERKCNDRWASIYNIFFILYRIIFFFFLGSQFCPSVINVYFHIYNIILQKLYLKMIQILGSYLNMVLDRTFCYSSLYDDPNNFNTYYVT